MEKLVEECKTLVQIEAELKSQVKGLKSQLFVEEGSLKLKIQTRDNLVERNSTLETLISSSKEQAEYLRGINQDMHKSYLMQALLKRMIAESEPNEQQQFDQVSRMRDEYDKLLKQYEQCPEYKKILEAEAEDKKLSEKLLEVRNELMKLDVQAGTIPVETDK